MAKLLLLLSLVVVIIVHAIAAWNIGAVFFGVPISTIGWACIGICVVLQLLYTTYDMGLRAINHD